MSQQTCEHRYEFLGLVWNEGRPVHGSGAYETIISEKFYCSKCLHTEYRSTGETRDTYTAHDGIHRDRSAPK